MKQFFPLHLVWLLVGISFSQLSAQQTYQFSINKQDWKHYTVRNACNDSCFRVSLVRYDSLTLKSEAYRFSKWNKVPKDKSVSYRERKRQVHYLLNAANDTLAAVYHRVAGREIHIAGDSFTLQRQYTGWDILSSQGTLIASVETSWNNRFWYFTVRSYPDRASPETLEILHLYLFRNLSSMASQSFTNSGDDDYWFIMYNSPVYKKK